MFHLLGTQSPSFSLGIIKPIVIRPPGLHLVTISITGTGRQVLSSCSWSSESLWKWSSPPRDEASLMGRPPYQAECKLGGIGPVLCHKSANLPRAEQALKYQHRHGHRSLPAVDSNLSSGSTGLSTGPDSSPTHPLALDHPRVPTCPPAPAPPWVPTPPARPWVPTPPLAPDRPQVLTCPPAPARPWVATRPPALARLGA